MNNIKKYITTSQYSEITLVDDLKRFILSENPSVVILTDALYEDFIRLVSGIWDGPIAKFMGRVICREKDVIGLIQLKPDAFYTISNKPTILDTQ